MRLLVIVPRRRTGVALLVLLVKWDEFGYGRPLYSQFPRWIWGVVRPELEFSKLFYFGMGLLFWPAEYLGRPGHQPFRPSCPGTCRATSGRPQLSVCVSFFIVVLPAPVPLW